MASDRFPIIQRFARDSTRRLCQVEPGSIPWEMIEPHRKHAERNHCGQTLEHLASRGGLSAMELWCALHGESLDPITTRRITEEAATGWLWGQLSKETEDGK